MVEFYVYQLIDPLDIIFYVGKGQGRRMYDHVKEVQKGRVPNDGNSRLGYKIRKILNSGAELKYEKIFFTRDEQEAYDYEKKVIARIGLENLCNMSAGGDGVTFTDEVRRKMSIASKDRPDVSAATRLKMSKALKGKIPWNKGLTGAYSDEHRRKISVSSKKTGFQKGHKVWNKGKTGLQSSSAETRAKLSEANQGQVPWNKGKTGSKRSIETRKKISTTLKARWKAKNQNHLSQM